MGPQEFALQEFALQEFALREFVWQGLTLLVAAGLCSAALIVALWPLFRRYALVRPNARSSHAKPTPQGGGLAVVVAMIVTLGAIGGFAVPGRAMLIDLLPLGGAVVILTAVGAVDDMFTIAVLPRLILQVVAVVLVVATLPAELRVVPVLPPIVERALEMSAGLWFVNLVNFMDGLDWMTVAETVPIAASAFLFAALGAAPMAVGLVALALGGAILGFAPFNRPVAKLFVGDVGSLPIGLILFWLLLQIGGRGHLAAALLLPLYYVADTTITLLGRMARGERITEAHRTHFYQIATTRGLPVMAVIGLVFGANVALAALAALSLRASSWTVDIAALAIGGAVVAALLVTLRRGGR
jgi:UDP-N-acetylmuramyl pentapeptide phosphotransferase/UDP-N-acetylglucosamine-1-phosphate transferase